MSWLLLAVLAAAPEPRRVVSLNLCTDQLVLGLLDRERIAGVSFLADDPDVSVEHTRASGLPRLHADAEEVLALAPDLVLAGRYGANETLRMLERVGIRVERFPPPESIDDARAQIVRAGALLGEPGRAQAWVDVLASIPPRAERPALRAVSYGFGGSTAGTGTLEDELLERGGFENLARRLGLGPYAALSMEQLVMGRPEVVVVSTYRASAPTLWREALHHPALVDRTHWTVVPLPSAWTSCPTPMLAAAVERLRAAARERAAEAAR